MPPAQDAPLQTFTLVSFHAHPDDEVLLTGGTLAAAAAQGHRVVLVVATDGAAGLSTEALRPDLAQRRDRELAESARALGCARVVRLGHPDSGSGPVAEPGGFATLEVETCARGLAQVLTEEDADVLTVYDPAGGYGHRDHVQVYRVGVRAAEIAGTPVVLEATLDRRLIRRAVGLVAHLPRVHVDVASFDTAYTDPVEITHRVNVRRHLTAKRAALRAHVSQAGGGPGVRTLALLLRLPAPVFALALGHEWFTERSRGTGRRSGDVFASLR